MRALLLALMVAPLACGGGSPNLGFAPCTTTSEGVGCTTHTCGFDNECFMAPDRKCVQDAGTFATDFRPLGCLGGLCTYAIVPTRCAANVSCGDCLSDGRCFGTECFACTAQAAPSPLSLCICGVCERCRGSTFCGGKDAVTTICGACAVNTLARPGACVKSQAFQDSCIAAADGQCRAAAQLIATCLNPVR